jgi:general secretion pathway protein F
MNTFTYTAINSQQKKIKGSIAAQNLTLAKQQLKSQGLIVIQIQEKKSNFIDLERQPKNQDICLFTRQLATFLSSGISLTDALSGMAEEQSQAIMKPVIQGIYQKVLEGYSLAQSLKQYPKLFSNLYCATIYAGEQSGQLDHVLDQLANYIEQQHFAKQKIQQALIYPSMMISVALMIIFFLMTQVVPKILAIFDDNQQSLPLMTKILMSMSHGFKVFFPFLVLIILLIGFIFYRNKDNLIWKRKWHQHLIQNRFYCNFIKMTQIPRYLHTMHILLSSGVNILESMNVSGQLISNLVIKDKFNEATQKVKEGISFSKALMQTQWVNSMSLHLIQSGEKSGQIAEMLERAAHQLDVQRQQWIDTSLKLLEPMIILLMGGFVLFVVLAILLPIFQMQQLV